MAGIREWRKVALSDIASHKDQFSFSWPYRAQRQAFGDSLLDTGVLRPLLVLQNGEKLQLVAGYRRLEWLQQNRFQTAPVGVLDSPGRVDLWHCLLEDSLDHRPLNPVEIARYILLRCRHTGENLHDLSSEVFPRLGLAPRVEAAQDLLWLIEQPNSVWEGFADGSRPLHVLRSLRGADVDDARAILNLTSGVPGSVNKFAEVVRWLLECAWQDGVGVREWIEREQFYGPWKRLDDLREALRRRRFPHLCGWEERFPRAVGAADLPRSVQVHAPKGFEGRRYECRMAFSSLSDLEECLRGTLQRLLEGKLNDLQEFLD